MAGVTHSLNPRCENIAYLLYLLSMTWEIKYHDEKLQEAVLALPAGLLARYLHLTDRMLHYGPDLGMPHTRAMGSGLFEMRLKEWKDADA